MNGIDLSKMGNFAKVMGDSAEIYREGEFGVTSGGTYTGRMSAVGRSRADKAANNAVRSQLLKALADSVGIGGYTTQADGRIRFDAIFVSRLTNILGKDFAKTLKLNKDFDIDKNGYVTSGKPLTERRISLVNLQLRELAAHRAVKLMSDGSAKVIAMAFGENKTDESLIRKFVDLVRQKVGGDPLKVNPGVIRDVLEGVSKKKNALRIAWQMECTKMLKDANRLNRLTKLVAGWLAPDGKSIHNHVKALENIRAEVDQVAKKKVHSDLPKGMAEKVVKGLLASPCSHLTLDQRTKVANLVMKFLETGANPVDAVRLAYVLTKGLTDMAKKIGDAKTAELSKAVKCPENYSLVPEGMPKKPVEPQEFTGIFKWKNKNYEAEKAKYDKEKAVYDEFMSNNPIIQYNAKIDANKIIGQEHAKAVIQTIFTVIEKKIDEFGETLERCGSDKAAWDIETKGRGMTPTEDLLLALKRTSDGVSKGIWEKTGRTGLDNFTARLQARVDNEEADRVEAFEKTHGFVVMNKAESSSQETAGTVKIDVKSLFANVEKSLKDKMSDYADIGEIEILPGKDGRTLNLRMGNILIKESKKIYDRLPTLFQGTFKDKIAGMWPELTFPLSFSVDPASGKLRLSLEKATSGSKEVSAAALMGVNGLLSVISQVLQKPADDMGVANVAPLVVSSETQPGSIITFEVDPSKLAPLKTLGLHQDTKFSCVSVGDGTLTLQFGGKTDKTAETTLPPNSDVAFKADFSGVADRLMHLMALNGIGTREVKIVGDAQNQKITVEVDHLNLDRMYKKTKGLKAAAMKVLTDGSYKLTFSPSLDPATGDVTLKIDGIESKRKKPLQGFSVWLAKKVVPSKHQAIEDLLRAALATVPGVDKNVPTVDVTKDPGDGILTLRVHTSSILNTPKVVNDATGKDLVFKPSALTLTGDGLGVGFNVINQE